MSKILPFEILTGEETRELVEDISILTKHIVKSNYPKVTTLVMLLTLTKMGQWFMAQFKKVGDPGTLIEIMKIMEQNWHEQCELVEELTEQVIKETSK